MSFNIGPSDCPICLESMTVSEGVFALPCHNCKYNFCSKCVSEFVRSSRDDFQVASDGSRQVKVHIACPQCRSKYPMDISKVLFLRQAHTLGSSAYTAEGEALADSELTATCLSQKRDFYTRSKRRQLQLAHGLYKQVLEGKVDLQNMATAETVCQRVFWGVPESTGESVDDDDDDDEYVDTPSSPRRPTVQVDNTLFAGLQDLMGRDEKMFLTDLLTCGDVSKLAQSAMILNGVLKLSMQPPSMRPHRSFENDNSGSNYRRDADTLNKTKKRFPLANHMPGYFIVPTFSSKQRYIFFDEHQWDGTIIPPMKGNRTFDQVYRDNYHPPNAENPRSVVRVQSVRGPAGRVGLRKYDVVTHINETEWTGTAQELTDHIYQLNGQHSEEEISITVNANPETALFLQVRKSLMERSQLELI